MTPHLRNKRHTKFDIEDPDTLISLVKPSADAYLKEASYSCELYKRKLDNVLNTENEANTQNFQTVNAYLFAKYMSKKADGAVKAYLIAKGYTDKFLEKYSQDDDRRPDDESRLEQIRRSRSRSSGSSKSSRSSSSRSGSSRSRKSSSSRSMSGSGRSGGSRRRFRLKSRRT
jgi:hypothetical protein